MIDRLPFDVSILISTHNEEKNIANLLASLARQTARNNIVEILIADNNSSDRTLTIIKKTASAYNLPVKTIPLHRNNLGDSRRQLVELTSTDNLVFIDADCKVHIRWLETLILHFSKLSKLHTKLAGVGGPNRLPEKNLFQKTINQNLDHGWLHGFSAQAHRALSTHGLKKDHLPTTNALIKKSAIIEAGNFSPLFERVGEDLELGLRMVRLGFELRMLPDPEVINDCASNLSSWLSRMFRFGQAQGMTLGMRFSAVTLLLLITSLWLFLLPFLQPQLQLFSLIAVLLAISLTSKPVTLKKYTLKNWIQVAISYPLAIMTLTGTIVAYMAGFYVGLIKSTPHLLASSNNF